MTKSEAESTMIRRQTPAATVMVARQPIFDRARRLHGYELLYRGGQLDHADITNGDHATAHVVTAALMDIGLDRIVARETAYINVTHDFLVSGAALNLPPERVVLEILEDVVVDDALVKSVRQLALMGYRLALDDFVLAPSRQPLLEWATVIKLDVLALSSSELASHVQQLAPLGVKLLAEKVETDAQYEALLDLGCDYFQGYFFARPNIVTGSRLPANRLATLRLLSTVHDPATTIEQVTELVAQDPALSYRLMRFINSAAVGLPKRVTSIHRAVLYIGLDAVKRWVSLTALAQTDHKHAELLVLTLTRARMMEQLSALLPENDAGTAFTVGLFSTLDAFMDQPLAKVVKQLPLGSEVTAALLRGEGRYGRVLRCVIDYEVGRWATACNAASDLFPERLASLYPDAVEWARGAMFAAH
ncbi:MAG: EAL domain-containing protein [Gammaproteobacteria bacterium]|nr:MAG: EAL domain-containing protein [Gammaproteobacteria bacterium]